MKQTVIQIGNSAGVIIPTALRKQMRLKKGSQVIVEMGLDKKSLIITRAGGRKSVSTVTPDFLEVLERVNKRYGPALAKLAKQ